MNAEDLRRLRGNALAASHVGGNEWAEAYAHDMLYALDAIEVVALPDSLRDALTEASLTIATKKLRMAKAGV